MQIYNWFVFYECGSSVNRLFTSEADNSFGRNDTEKKMFELLCSFLGSSLSPTLEYMPDWLGL